MKQKIMNRKRNKILQRVTRSPLLLHIRNLVSYRMIMITYKKKELILKEKKELVGLRGSDAEPVSAQRPSLQGRKVLLHIHSLD